MNADKATETPQPLIAVGAQVDRGVRPHVTSVRVTYGEPCKKPKAGDRRTTKTRGVQIRVQRMARDWQGKPIGRIVSGGRPCYDWRTPRELDPWDHYLLTAEERAALTGRPAGWTCAKCGTDRTKAVCPKGHDAALTGACPMVGIAA